VRVKGGRLAVALHDVEPETFGRVMEIRSWLARRGVDRVTLLVIPASGRRPVSGHAALGAWLRSCVASGDAVAQHGFTHRSTAQAVWPRRVLAGWQGGAAAEFPGLDGGEALARVTRGRAVLEEAGLSVRGFVAPGYAYTRGLRYGLPRSHEWFADLTAVRIRDRDDIQARALCLGASTPFKRAVSPALVRSLSHAPGRAMRVDVHPADFDHRLHMATLEWLLDRARGREAVTYDDLLR
jgi:predicted deacetylase